MTARRHMEEWAKSNLPLGSDESYSRLNAIRRNPECLSEHTELQGALLDFIADFADWDNVNNQHYLRTTQLLTQAAHEALGGEPGTRPLVADPFAGGAAIPLEALRVGADAFATDLNPVAVLLNKMMVEYVPRYGSRLANAVKEWGEWIGRKAEEELGRFYPSGPSGATPIAYLWARTARCEGPGCGATVPLMRSLWLAKKAKGSVALHLMPHRDRKEVEIVLTVDARQRDVGAGTIKRGAVTCPVCGFTTPVERVREQLRRRRGGAGDARLIAVRYDDPTTQDRSWRLPTDEDVGAALAAATQLRLQAEDHRGHIPLIPDEPLPPGGTLGFRVQRYGMASWGDLFSPRQQLALVTFTRLVRTAPLEGEPEFQTALRTALALAVDRLADYNASLCVLNSVGGRGLKGTFARQALPMVWDFMETNPFNTEAANWQTCIEVSQKIIAVEEDCLHPGAVEQADATQHPLPDDSASAFVTDPPYYDAVPYAALSEFFTVWLRRSLNGEHGSLFARAADRNAAECIVDPVSGKDDAHYRRTMSAAMAEGRRILAPGGVGVVVFAHKSTSGWETQLDSMIEAGWTITGSWPIDTERPARLRAQNSAALASSVHLVCRPRTTDEVGDWGDVLRDLPVRIRAWMPRLATEGVVGADAIFACLGPALEVFSRYSHVERANGERVSLRDYLENVWGEVSREALNEIFNGGDTSGFEEDARLTAIWFWVLNSAPQQEGENRETETDEIEDSDSSDPEDEADVPSASSSGRRVLGYAMEYDAARKLAQGLGADLGKLGQPGGIVTVKGGTATLNFIREREGHLLGRQTSLFGDVDVPTRKGRSRNVPSPAVLRSVQVRQEALFAEPVPPSGPKAQAVLPFAEFEEEPQTLLRRLLDSGTTILDRLHQAMLLFGRSQEALLRLFLTESSMGTSERFWRLAQALSALYPKGSEEKRWVDGVLARKKSLGF